MNAKKSILNLQLSFFLLFAHFRAIFFMHNNEFFSFFYHTLKIISWILPILFWVSIILSFDETPIALLTFTCAIIHEMGHVLFLFLRSSSGYRLKGVFSGLRIYGHKTISYKDELILYLCGPLINILFSLFSLITVPYIGYFAIIFSILNYATALSNLLPIEGYDGYGILRCFLALKGYDDAQRILPIISFITILVLSIFSLYFIDRFGEGYWIFFVFSASLIKKLDLCLSNNKYEI
jgi:Zn-dependent protease